MAVSVTWQWHRSTEAAPCPLGYLALATAERWEAGVMVWKAARKSRFPTCTQGCKPLRSFLIHSADQRDSTAKQQAVGGPGRARTLTRPGSMSSFSSAS